jgi:CubicO group peptidase (beta-lactamase class C family)
VNQAFTAIATDVAEKKSPGAVGLILKDGHIIARRAIGNMQTDFVYRSSETDKITYVPMSERMLENTLFDLASLTKAVATTTSIMILVEQGKIDLNAPVVQYIPSFGARAKEKVTVLNLLTHSSGLPAWFPFYDLYINREEVFASIDEDIALEFPPGEKRVYSDMGFMMLGRLVETVSGQRLDRFAAQNIFEPLGMKNTMYLPDLLNRLRTAPTEYDPARNRALKGIVHDENGRALGGVSGHAGLFSTVNDLAIFAQMLLSQGEFNGKRILKEETLRRMLTPQLSSSAYSKGSRFLRYRKQLLGWWGMDDNAVIGDIGGLPSKTAFGHSGFTGTMMYVDPEHKAAAILLANAIHPRRDRAEKSRLYRDFFVNVSKALVGEQNVKTQPEEK